MSGLPVLSKTRYVQGLQCPKLLWHVYHAREMFPPADALTQAIFDQGHEVGRLARQLFGGGILVEDGIPPDEVAARSTGLLARRVPLFEAGFKGGDVFARADILEPAGRTAWNLVEVKSAASVGDPYFDDLAVQRHCYRHAGLEIRACSILHVNTAYVRRGPVDPAGLFRRVEVTAEVDRRSIGLPRRIRQMQKVIQAARSPEVEIGPQCSSPYPCPLIPVCWNGVLGEPRSIFSLRHIGSRAWKLYRGGVRTTDRIPPDFRLSRAQRLQVEAEGTGRPHVNAPAVRRFLASLRYPLHYLDFETFNAAVPLVEATRPYQQVPFQFSLHVAPRPRARLRHFSWIWDGRGNPMAILLDELGRAIGREGSVVAYGAAFERQRLKECAEARPGRAGWVEGVLGRVVDLLVPFRSFAVYYPAQQGSASMKKVLPAATGTSYKDLAIQEGGQASLEYRRITFGNVSAEERRRVRAQLEEYCGLDTRGMADIVEALEKLIS